MDEFDKMFGELIDTDMIDRFVEDFGEREFTSSVRTFYTMVNAISFTFDTFDKINAAKSDEMERFAESFYGILCNATPCLVRKFTENDLEGYATAKFDGGTLLATAGLIKTVKDFIESTNGIIPVGKVDGSTLVMFTPEPERIVRECRSTFTAIAEFVFSVSEDLRERFDAIMATGDKL